MLLSSLLNERIVQLAPKMFNVADCAPDTFDSLRHGNVAPLTVWSGASDVTVYGDCKVNFAFRAWHDELHLKLNAPFTLEGETRVALEQARLLGSDNLAAIILAEVVGQAEHFAKYGEFPVNQIDFILKYLAGKS